MRPTAPTQTGPRLRDSLVRVLLLAGCLTGCSETLPTLLLTVDDPDAVGPSQLRVSIATPGEEALSITRPETAGEPLAPGQTLRVLLPDSAVGAEVQLGVEALIDGHVHGRAQGTFTPVAGKELEARLTLSPIDPSACNAASCPDGCCQDGVCLPNTLEACGIQGGACSACETTRADVCLQGACRCGADPACDAGYQCSAGTCVPTAPQTCAQDIDCYAYQSPGQCYALAPTCESGICHYSPKASGTPCDDGNGCNDPDVCDGAGQCRGAPELCPDPPDPQCFESQPGTCVGGACQFQPRAQGTACSTLCIPDGACGTDGQCEGTSLSCDTPPNSECFQPTGVCDEVQGCVYTAVEDGVPCSDGRYCTVGDACQAGACIAGSNPCSGDAVCCEQPSSYTCSASMEFECIAISPEAVPVGPGHPTPR